MHDFKLQLGATVTKAARYSDENRDADQQKTEGSERSPHGYGPQNLTKSSNMCTGIGACSVMVLEKLTTENHEKMKLEPHLSTCPESNSKCIEFEI